MMYLRGIRLSKPPEEESYIWNIPAVSYLKQVDGLTFHSPVTFFVGENGTGKSTLLEAIAVSMGFNAEGGSRDFSFSTKETHSQLYEWITTIKTVSPKDGFFLRAESFYNIASYLDENSELKRYGNVSFHEQSHGEAFLSLITNRFEGNGLYLLDEPESALSPLRLMSLLAEIDRLVKEDSQFIIATHSPILLAFPQAEIYECSDSGIRKVMYRETESYQLTKQFLDNPEGMLHYLLES